MGISFLTSENIVKRKNEFQDSDINVLNDLIDCTGHQWDI